MAVWLGCLGAMLNRRVLYTKRTDIYGKRNYNFEYTLLPLLYAVTKEEKGHTVREWSITIYSIGFDIISSFLLYMQWYKLITQSIGRSQVNTEFTKPRRQLQRLWRHIKIELRVRLRALRWFYVGHVYKIGKVSFHLIGTSSSHVRGKNCTKGRAPRAWWFFFLIQPIKSLIYDVVVAVAVVVSYKTPW